MVISGLIVGVLAMPSAGGLEGAYYSGDGRGVNVVYELAAGGSLRRTRSGCMGIYRVETGTWRRAGEFVVFEYLTGAKSAREFWKRWRTMMATLFGSYTRSGLRRPFMFSIVFKRSRSQEWLRRSRI